MILLLTTEVTISVIKQGTCIWAETARYTYMRSSGSEQEKNAFEDSVRKYPLSKGYLHNSQKSAKKWLQIAEFPNVIQVIFSK